MRPAAARKRAWSLIATLLLVLGLAAGPSAAAIAAPDPASDCTDAGGIYVYVIDQGTRVLEGCTHAETGLGRLLELTTVQTAGQGFVCQIDGKPQRCVANPAGDEPYWSYWWWREDQWRYATIGASYRGIPGSIEAWHFSPGEPPPMLPPGQVVTQDSVEPTPPSASPSSAPGQAGTGRGGGLTAITVVVITAAGLGYGLWYRKQKQG